MKFIVAVANLIEHTNKAFVIEADDEIEAIKKATCDSMNNEHVFFNWKSEPDFDSPEAAIEHYYDGELIVSTPIKLGS